MEFIRSLLQPGALPSWPAYLEGESNEAPRTYRVRSFFGSSSRPNGKSSLDGWLRDAGVAGS